MAHVVAKCVVSIKTHDGKHILKEIELDADDMNSVCNFGDASSAPTINILFDRWEATASVGLERL